MSTTTPLRVNTKALVDAAFCSGWHACCLKVLAALADDVEPYRFPGELIRRLPASFDFATLRKQVSVDQLLDVIDSLESTDHAPTSGRLLLAMAEKFFQPQVPASHPAYPDTRGLLSTLRLYLEGRVNAEIYISSAYHYRSQYGTTITAAGTDSEYEFLFEAMPSEGLDCPAGKGSWNLASHWWSFGRFLASRRDEWRVLDSIESDLDVVTLLEHDPAADQEAAEAVRCKIIDPQREALAEIELEAYCDMLETLVEQYFPAAAASTTGQG